MSPQTLDAKALDACAFSVHHRAASLAVPSKLVGTSRHQALLRSLSRDPSATWLALDLDARGPDLVVSHGARVLGRVQPKHLGWIRPLVSFGLALYLSRVTGADGSSPRGYRLGCNVAFGHVGEALACLKNASHGGDDAPSHQGRSPLRLVVTGGARVQTAPPAVPVLPQAEASPMHSDDVVLWRTPRATPAPRSPTLPSTRQRASNGATAAPARPTSRGACSALTDEPTADALYQRFKQDVVAIVPEVGGVLRAADIRAWVEHARTR